MNVFLYEWITGGGLVEQTGKLPASLLAEGWAMVSAAATDFAALEGCRVTLLRDVRLDLPAQRGCRVMEVHSEEDRQAAFDEAAATADWTMVIAPEFDEVLLKAAARARRSPAQSLNCSDEFIAIASCKERTAIALAKADVPIPYGTRFDAEEQHLPRNFPYPAVLKPLDGAGSQHTYLLESHYDEPEAYPWPRRLERYVPGRAASVSFVCGHGQATPLPPCWQNLSRDGRLRYRGGRLMLEAPLAARAVALAARAMAAMPPALGYVGVDLVLGPETDGSGDAVIEINPRLTTSYAGLRAAMSENLAHALLLAAQGEPVRWQDEPDPIEFAATGETWLAGMTATVADAWH